MKVTKKIFDLFSKKILMDCKISEPSFFSFVWLMVFACFLFFLPAPHSPHPSLVQQYHTNFVN